MITVTKVENQLKTWLLGLIKDLGLCDVDGKALGMFNTEEYVTVITELIDKVISQHGTTKVDFVYFVEVVSKIYKVTNEIENYMTDPETVITAVKANDLVELDIINSVAINDTSNNSKRAQILLNTDDSGSTMDFVIREDGKETSICFEPDAIHFSVKLNDNADHWLETFGITYMIIQVMDTKVIEKIGN